MILSLLEDSHARQELLEVPHTGAQKDRFTSVIQAHNLCFQLYNQPEIWHYCNKCVCFYHGPDGKVTHMVYVVVIDGVTVGHPCCAIHNCHVSLANNQHRFCPEDAPLHDKICSIVDCSDPVLHGQLACRKAEHQEVECIHRECGQARFQLQECLQFACVAHPENASAEEHDLSELVDMDESEEEFEVEAQHEVPAGSHLVP
jgi:CxC6 like cysteine cluster associated with KDZ transposases